MRSYREAFDVVVARFPDAYVSTAGHETDTMFIIPPRRPQRGRKPNLLRAQGRIGDPEVWFWIVEKDRCAFR